MVRILGSGVFKLLGWFLVVVFILSEVVMLELLGSRVEGVRKRFREVGMLEWIFCVRLRSEILYLLK